MENTESIDISWTLLGENKTVRTLGLQVLASMYDKVED